MSPVLLSIAVIQVMTILVVLVRSKLLSVLLGPAQFGIVSTVDQVVMTMVQLGALGIPFTALKYMSRAHSRGRSEFLSASSGFLRLLSVTALATTVISSAVFVWYPGAFGSDLLPYRLPLQLALIGIPALTLNILFINTLAAAEQPATAAQLNLVVALNLATGAVVGGWLGGVTGLYVGLAVAGVLAVLGSYLFLRRRVALRFSGPTRGLFGRLKQRREVVSASGSMYLAMAAYSLSLLAIRATVLSDLGAVEAGLFQAALSIALTVGAVLTPMSNLFLGPLVNQDIPLAAKVSAANSFAGEMLLFLLLGALPIVLFPRLVLQVLFTSAFAPVASAIGIFVLWQCVYQLGYIYQQLLIGLDDMFFMALTTATGYATAALLALVLTPRFGLVGVATSLLLGMVIYGLAAAIRLRARHQVRIPFRVLGRSGYVAAVVLGATVLFKDAGDLTFGDVGLRLLYGATAIAALWLALPPSERERILSMPRALLGRANLVTPGSMVPPE